MRAIQPLRARFCPGAMLIVTCLILTGCSTPTARRSQADSDIVRIPESWTPHLLFLLPSPHSRLYVEVDAVEGCVPKEITLQNLRNFLSKYCNKPDGIEIVRSDVIPVGAARGISEKALARKYVNGPARTTGSPLAFMYILFYNDALCKGSIKVKHSGATTAQGSPRRATNPYTDISPYPAIYFNTRYVPWYFPGMEKKGLLHEAGHMLGLVRRPADVFLHCNNRPCLMNSNLSAHRLLFGQQKRICPQCAAELAEDLMQPSPSNLRFVGSVVVRSEADYHVLSLPDRLEVIVGNLAEKDCLDFAVRIRAETPNANRGSRVDCLIKEDVLKEPGKVNEMVNRLKADPFDQVRVAAPDVLLRVAARRFGALGQYSNAVATLHQAILMGSQDGGSYNQLAWIKATCSDAAVRDGKEAVSAANKACELTEWKNWMFIDTLAAAYAEAGDFKHAVEFQERALRTGNPTASEQKRMRERLSLYEQSTPFRDKPNGP